MVLGMRNCLLDVCSKTLPALSIALIKGCVLKNLSYNGFHERFYNLYG